MLLFAGRIQPLKAPDVLLRAVAVLLDETPEWRSRLVVPIVGGPSGTGLEHPESLAQLAAELGLDDVVRFVPPVAQDELARWCAAATLVAVPSYNESFGLVAVEAQATGTPVIAAAVGGLTTVVRDQHSGLLVDSHAPRDWAATLRRVVEDDRLRARLERGRDRAGAPVRAGTAPPTGPWRSTAGPAPRCARKPCLDGGVMTADVIRSWLDDNEIEYQEPSEGVFSFSLPGEKKLQTPVRLDVGPHALGVHAFVCRNPDENHERVYRWLLERNLKMYAVAFAVDRHGDIYLDARLPLGAVTADELDRLLGSVLSHGRRVVQLDPRARFRVVHPQGVGVAQAARRADPQPRGVPWLARVRRRARPVAEPQSRDRVSGPPARPRTRPRPAPPARAGSAG